MRYQTTIYHNTMIAGIGLHSGKNVEVSFKPLGPNSGICIRHRKSAEGSFRLEPKLIQKTFLATNLKIGSALVQTVEHLLAAIVGLEIDNILIEADDEIPILDGSAAPWCELLLAAGLRKQAFLRKLSYLRKRIEVRQGDRFLIAEPLNNLFIHSVIEFAHPAIGRQEYSFEGDYYGFIDNIAPARTFGILEEAKKIQAQGLLQGASEENALVYDGQRLLNPEGLRFENEPARHKILDIMGDLAVLGKPLCAKITAYKSGHELHAQLLHEISTQAGAYEETTIGQERRKKGASFEART